MSDSIVHTQLYSTFLLNFIVTLLLSAGLRIELQLLHISEMGKFHTLTLTVGDWTFEITVTRHNRPKPGHSNKRVYCKQIDRTLKMRFKEWSPRFLRPTISQLWKFLKNQFCCFLDRKKHRYTILKIFSPQNRHSTHTTYWLTKSG